MSALKPLASITLLLLAILSRAPALGEPTPCSAPPLQASDLLYWPVHQRTASDGFGPHRSGLMNSFGEFQHFSPVYVHTGIDIRGVWNGAALEGDLVRVVADGDLWAVPSFTGDTCTSDNNCRAYVKSTNRRVIYYYSHLNLRTDADSEVRERFETASITNPANPLEVGANPVQAGDKLAGLGIFSSIYSHLHFGIFDACENYDGLNPLLLLPPPQVDGSDYVDENEPEIQQFVLLRNDGQTLVTDGTCATPLTGSVDLVAEAKDVYRDLTGPPDSLAATDSMGVYRASYRIKRTPNGSPLDRTWYEFDRAPFRCRGELRGNSCADPVPFNSQALTLNDFINLAEIPTAGGPALALTYSDTLFNTQSGAFDSDSSYYGTEEYFHVLTHDWGFDNAPGHWDTTASADGRYQLSVEVADAAGNKDAAHRFVVVQNGAAPASVTGDLVLRDNPVDVGAVPSTLGGEKFWISPDIKVRGPGESDPTDPTHPIWNSAQDVDLIVGQNYKVWIRLENTGCEPVNDVNAKVAWADPAMIQTSFQQIDVEKSGGNLAGGAATVVGPFDWTPTSDQAGHRCLLAISRSVDDAPTVPNFGVLVDGWGGTVANDNNIGQLNLQITGTTTFSIINPQTSTADVELDYDCNDFPVSEAGAVAELRAQSHPALLDAWRGVPRTALTQDGSDLVLRFAGCKVALPPARLPGGTIIPASFNLELGSGPAGVFRVDLTQKVEDAPAGGMSFAIERFPPIP